MLKLTRNGSILLAIAFLLTGCGKSASDLVKQKIAVMKDMAADFDKVTDKASMELAGQSLKIHTEKLNKIEEQLDALGPEAKEAAITANKDELELATKSFGLAKSKAAQAVYGSPK